MSAEGGLFDEDEDDGGHCDGELNDQIHVSIFTYSILFTYTVTMINKIYDYSDTYLLTL